MSICGNEDVNRENCIGCMYLIEYTQEKRYECMVSLEPSKKLFIYGDQQLLSEIKLNTSNTN